MESPADPNPTPGPAADSAPEGHGRAALPAPPVSGSSRAEPRRLLRHRLPVRLRHHWKLLAALVVGCLAVTMSVGGVMVRPYITSDLTSETVVTENIEGETDLFDSGEHSIEITYNEAEYADMINSFQEDGEKDFITADITIDGTVIQDVGLRLKGNSTLSSLGGDEGGGMPGAGEGQQRQGAPGAGGAPERGGPSDSGGASDGGGASDSGGATTSRGASDGGGAQAGDGAAGMGGMAMVQLSEDKPEELPWLISFDEYQEGRAYQGNTEIAVRPAAGGSDAAVNEALALELTAQSEQATQDYTFTTMTVNGGESAARLVVDSPDAVWADTLGEGALYKGRAGGSLDYVGEDPTDYETSFTQINGEGSYDLQPVIDLLKFIDESDDDEFASEIDEHLDVESFATYLATQELLSNWDAMDGAGNNYYLWYDATTEKFTVLSWDLNLALSGMDMGGGAPGEGGGGGGMPEMPQDGEGLPGLPEGVEVPEGFEMPESGQMPGGGAGIDVGKGSGRLKERLLEDESFYALYESAYEELYSTLIESGAAESELEELAGRAESVGDTNARTASTTLAEQLAEIPAEAPEPSSSMLGG